MENYGQIALSKILLMALAGLNVAPIKTPKFSGGWYYFITGCTLLFTIISGCKIL